MNIIDFMDYLKQFGGEFFTGVPDSQLSPLCNHLIEIYGISDKHIIASNEGNCVALAAGYHLSTGKTPIVYLQNSGLGNIINPVVSLLNDKVYGIPCIFVVGWRGEPGVKDEPQHIFQGEITIAQLELLNITVIVLDRESTIMQLQQQFSVLQQKLDNGQSIAFVVKKDALSNEKKAIYQNKNSMKREDIIRQITIYAGQDLIVSTTGKASRELFEIREQNKQSHQYDFLTVGSMGHSSSIALGIAMNKPDCKIWCIDGDGAALMHLGAMAVIGSNRPSNLVHIVINNEAHETVGGIPTVAKNIDLVLIAQGCGYPRAISVSDFSELTAALEEASSSRQLMFIEIKAAQGAREDLGRPTTTATQNKKSFMKHISEV